MNELQKRVFEVFCQFVNICGDMGVKYYALGGTMLGAVRHKGFIPWDDDVDVGMMREDYELFCKKATDYLPDFYFLQTYKKDAQYPLGTTKLRDSRTTFIETRFKYLKMNHGVYIDIFPLDYYPDSGVEQIKLARKQSVYKYRIRMADNRDGLHSKPAEFFASMYGNLLRLKYPTVGDAVGKRDRLYASIPQSRLIANYYGAWGKKEIVPAEWYGEGASAEFEGLSVTVPKEYDKWLTQVYGDYMQLPPPEKRVSHHHIDLIDLEKPYTYYMGEVN